MRPRWLRSDRFRRRARAPRGHRATTTSISAPRIIGGLVDAQLANDPGGDRWRRLLDRAVDMFADNLGLPPDKTEEQAMTSGLRPQAEQDCSHATARPRPRDAPGRHRSTTVSSRCSSSSPPSSGRPRQTARAGTSGRWPVICSGWHRWQPRVPVLVSPAARRQGSRQEDRRLHRSMRSQPCRSTSMPPSRPREVVEQLRRAGPTGRTVRRRRAPCGDPHQDDAAGADRGERDGVVDASASCSTSS